MNTFDIARRANEARRDHSCRKGRKTGNCPLNAEGRCLVKIALWAEQNKAALNWNKPQPQTSNSYR